MKGRGHVLCVCSFKRVKEAARHPLYRLCCYASSRGKVNIELGSGVAEAAAWLCRRCALCVCVMRAHAEKSILNLAPVSPSSSRCQSQANSRPCAQIKRKLKTETKPSPTRHAQTHTLSPLALHARAQTQIQCRSRETKGEREKLANLCLLTKQLQRDRSQAKSYSCESRTRRIQGLQNFPRCAQIAPEE